MINPTQKGFTLIEMIVVLGIFAVMTSIVVFNYGKFTSETILTNMAYEVALSLREAQIYGTSVRGALDSPNFEYSYGIYFEINSPNYVLFSDKLGNNNDKYDGDFVCETSSECLSVYGLQRGIVISDLRTVTNSNSGCGNLESTLDIVFRRPNPEAIFGPSGNQKSQAQITLKAPGVDGSERYVVVSNNGQMYVTNDSICN